MFALLFASLLSWNAHAIDNSAYAELSGENNIEREVYWAWKQLPQFLQICRYSKDCGLNDEQIGFATQISRHLVLNPVVAISFKSEAEGSFTSQAGEVERLALTALQPGPIVLNRDRAADNGRSRGVPFWMGILAHELVHQLGVPDDQNRKPDLFGTAITAAAAKLSSRVSLPEGGDDISLFILNPPTPYDPNMLLETRGPVFFHALLMDQRRAVDMIAITSLEQTINFCGGKIVFAVIAKPDSATIVNAAGQLRAKVLLNGTAGCVDFDAGKSWGDELFFMNLFGVKQEGGHNFIDLTQYQNWGEAHPSEGAGAFQRVQIISSNIPTDVKAGETLKIQARLKWKGRFHVVGCSAFYSSPSWPADYQAQSSVLLSDRCQLTPLGDDTYDVVVERDIAPGTPDIGLSVQNLCLDVDAPGDSTCMPAYPARQTVVNIHQLAPQQAAAIENVHFENRQNDRAEIVFTIRNATGIASLASDFDVDDVDGNALTILVPFVVSNGAPWAPNDVVRSLTLQASGADLIVRAQLILPPQLGVMHPATAQLMHLFLISKELQAVPLDVSGLNLVLKTAEGI